MHSSGRQRRRFIGAALTLPCWTLTIGEALAASSCAPRVASLSWRGAEILSKLGHPPVAVSDKTGFGRLAPGFDHWLPRKCVELGLGVEPNMELLDQLRPALILADRDQLNYVTGLQSIAPVFSLDIYRDYAGDAYYRAKVETLRLGKSIDRAATAQAYVASVERMIRLSAQQVAALRNVPPVLICELHLDGRTITVFGKGSVLHDVMNLLGVENVWQQSSQFGFQTINIERLAALPDFHLFYMQNESRTAAALANLDKGEIWRHLPVVKAGRLGPLRQIFTSGALNTAEQFAMELVSALSIGINAM
ncbi:ABC transporter substrate-binding protein [Burkholderia multivorans]|uniref:ABC transporter substrate-binding protein n=1 Tax=Burkholderia multivorans TaxID=87883 RepID=UPI001C94F556|nr:ABC transporter substrate-binding protein [Burkholderia multivorans]MBY4674331.1 ABC transporter substrate-binding protein [Burkholderia multivorans]